MTHALRYARLAAAIAAVSIGLTTLSACGDSTASGSTGSGGTASNEWGLKPAASVAGLVPSDFKDATVKNAVYNDYPPEMFLQEGKLVGLQVDLVNAAAAVMGIKLENIPVGSFDSIIPGLAGKRYDLSSSDFGVTAERVKQVDFVTLFDLGTSFAVKSGSGLTIEARDDLCGHSVAVIAGSYFIDQVKDISNECTSNGQEAIDLQTFPQQSAAVLAVSNGRVDAIGASADVIAYTAQQEAAQVDLTPYIEAPIPQGFAFQKGSGLVNPFQAAVQELIKNGTYAKIMDKWGLADLAWTDPANVKVNNTAPSA
jgi:polar amino acid transport system substrate-binding protein